MEEDFLVLLVSEKEWMNSLFTVQCCRISVSLLVMSGEVLGLTVCLGNTGSQPLTQLLRKLLTVAKQFTHWVLISDWLMKPSWGLLWHTSVLPVIPCPCQYLTLLNWRFLLNTRLELLNSHYCLILQETEHLKGLPAVQICFNEDHCCSKCRLRPGPLSPLCTQNFLWLTESFHNVMFVRYWKA